MFKAERCFIFLLKLSEALSRVDCDASNTSEYSQGYIAEEYMSLPTQLM